MATAADSKTPLVTKDGSASAANPTQALEQQMATLSLLPQKLAETEERAETQIRVGVLVVVQRAE